MASHILCCWCKEHLVVFVTDANSHTLPQLICGWLCLLITPGVQGVYRLCLLSLDFPGDSLQLGEKVGGDTPVG